MSSELIVYENTLGSMRRQFEDVLADRMPADRLIRTLVIAAERLPDLLTCNRQSLINAGITFGVLALETDGVTGQGYILPFKKQAQPIIGYKGYNTIGARSGLTITAGHVREGDEFDFAKGSKPFIHHKERLGNTGAIIAAWACATAKDRPPIVEVLSIDAIMAIKNKSPGAKRAESPWSDPSIGFPAMAEKSARRRLARSTPMNWASPEFQYAAVMEEAFEERGKHAYIAPGKGVVIEGTVEQTASDTPPAGSLTGPREDPALTAAREEGTQAAELGLDTLQKWWGRLSPLHRAMLAEHKEKLKAIAMKADAAGDA